MLPDVAQKIEERNAFRPARIIHELRGIFLRFKIQQLCELHCHAGDVVIQNFFRQQLTLGSFAARIADAARRAAGDGNGMMAEQLKSAQSEERHKIADVQRIRRRVEAAVKRDGRGGFILQLRHVRAIGNQPAPFKFFQNAHGRRLQMKRRIGKQN
jgi:hypothetical protein